MPDFWRNSGYHLLTRNSSGRVVVTDDFLRAYYLRPEIHPVEESCDAEHRLHAALMHDPRRAVPVADVEALRDADARDNYRILLRFRDRLIGAESLEACYAGLFHAGNVDVPPLFIEQLAHVILRNILDGCEEPLRLRAAELFFREQKASVKDGQILLADLETVEMHAAGGVYGSLGKLIVEAQGSLGRVELDVLDRDNAALYWQRDSRHDTLLGFNHGRAAIDAYCRVIEAWVQHFTGARVSVASLARIEEPRWAWHIGLDAESSAILNDLWNGVEVEHGRMLRVLALFRMEFANAADMRADIAGQAVVLALSSNPADVVRMKPQNLLVNLPLARRS
ncbi:MAG: hypothetical protein HY017_09335 [Betaproteobacteria bacterium]|nr:hypothetical protein [Betaproteobacteria bacterium]